MTEFKCQRCGKCCGIVPFSRSEMTSAVVAAIQKHLTVHFKKEKIGDRTFYIAKEAMKTLTCPFLRRDFKGFCSCAIYEDRPQVCRDFGKGGHPLLQCPNDPRTDNQAISKRMTEILNKMKEGLNNERDI